MYEFRDGRMGEFMVAWIHGCTDSWLHGFMVARIHGCMDEYTGLHPVLGYFAPSGLGGSMDNPDSLAMNARIITLVTTPAQTI